MQLPIWSLSAVWTWCLAHVVLSQSSSQWAAWEWFKEHFSLCAGMPVLGLFWFSQHVQSSSKLWSLCKLFSSEQCGCLLTDQSNVCLIWFWSPPPLICPFFFCEPTCSGESDGDEQQNKLSTTLWGWKCCLMLLIVWIVSVWRGFSPVRRFDSRLSFLQPSRFHQSHSCVSF